MDYEKMSNDEINLLVAERIFNWKAPSDPMPPCSECGASLMRQKCMWELGGACPRHDQRQEWELEQRPHPFSTDIVAAFTVVEHLRQEGWRFRCGDLKNGWTVEFYGWKDMEFSKAEGETFTLPRAICIAALKSITT